MSKGMMMVIIAAIGVVESIILLICFHLYFRKKEKAILKKIETE